MTNMDITNCSAITDIIINIGYNGAYQNLRVGGIAGVSRGTVNYCYAGGSMSSISSMGYKNWNAGANIWMGGLVGGIVLRNDGLDSLIGTVKNVMRVYNSYSYVDMPRRSGGQWGEKTLLRVRKQSLLMVKCSRHLLLLIMTILRFIIAMRLSLPY